MASVVGEDEKRHAFTVKLGVHLPAGRQSQIDSVQNVKVTNQTLVSYFFELGAFLFRSVHGRDKAELEKDYDVCLIKENGELILHPKREISHYHIGKDDILELRHKALPIMLTVNLWEGQEKSMKVYSGAPVMDIIPAVCKELGIEEDTEMSLAYPIVKVKDHTPCLRWLDPSSSLNSQGVIDGDTLLLRKKFFILNEDITEALERNSTLKELLYQQAFHHYTSEVCRIHNMDLDSVYSQTYLDHYITQTLTLCTTPLSADTFPRLSIYFNHIEEGLVDASSSINTLKRISKWSEGTDQNNEQMMEAYRLQQSVKSIPKGTAKSTVLQLISEPSAILVAYFPVRMQDSSKELVMAVSSENVSICEVDEDGKLKVLPEKSWRLKDIRESCQQTEHSIRINTLGYWQELFTEYAIELSNYISESERISRRKATKNRSSTCIAASPEPHVPSDLSTVVENPIGEAMSITSNTNNSSSIPGDNITEISHMQPEPLSSLNINSAGSTTASVDNQQVVSNDPKQTPDVEEIKSSENVFDRQSIVASASTSMDASSNGSNSLEVVSHGSVSLDMDKSGSTSLDVIQSTWTTLFDSLSASPPAVKTASTSLETAMSLDAYVTTPEGQRDSGVLSSSSSDTPRGRPSPTSDKANSASPQKSTSAGASNLQTVYQWPPGEEKIPSATLPKRPFNVIYSPAKSNQSTKKQHSRQGSQVSRTESVRSKTSQKSSQELICIPPYLSLDFRAVVERHRLFHIVVMKQDIRPLLLDITTTVKEAIEIICGTFGICNPENYYLAIPPGIQSIVEKYGGRPRSLVGRFKKSEHSMKSFASRLDGAKSLQIQYDYSIQPYLLHLRKFQHAEEDDVDTPDVSIGSCGEEWPISEHPDVARYRKFYQGWIGVVQGAYPVTRETAIQLAAHLTGVYFEKKAGRPWPPRDYDPKAFLPEQHRSVSGISSQVMEAYTAIEGIQLLDCINKVINLCSVQQGVFFEVAIPTKGDLIPTKRMKKVLFGVSQNGLFTVEKEAGMVHLKRDLAQIHDWACSDNSFHLDFKTWGEPFYGYTFQTKEVIDTLKMYLDIAKRRKIMEEFELERTREELLRLGHLDEEKKVDLSMHQTLTINDIGDVKDAHNGPQTVVEERNNVQFRNEPNNLLSARDDKNNKRISTLSTLTPLSLDVEFELLTPLRV